ncbi:phosphotransferase family protein [Streptomyces zagrosensis]|uniref:Aminoglycoside phosphotransferase (APT) family kinase protein n=1 Tax=Streptomyces zagrosensis TaxID=1042984 RepID=A0A7W9Q9Y6_9ACTN|nr:phosphotransferase family protein [Streptomyces zagrosensis]MBB5936340.1 aminoglycoside phosphotransferase (APT) family kinase protein [Streptomyces zagrosensis]
MSAGTPPSGTPAAGDPAHPTHPAPPGVDLAGVRAYLDRERPGLVDGPLRAELIEGGRSNLTYAISDGTARWVLRRPPLGHVLATAHDMAREYRVISALHPTGVPVPEPLALCTDESVTGSPFYVMEYVAGTPYRSAKQLAALGPQSTRALLLDLVDTLVELHTVDPTAVGLADFGRPDGYLERQLRRWGKQLAASKNRELPGIDALREKLTHAVPPSPAPTVLHGDYRLDNVLVGADRTITAVLDWEMSTLGDPLSDLGLLVMYTEQPEFPDSPLSTTRGAPGHPEAAELIARYAERSGRDVSHIAWYAAFAFFKLAVIAEGIHYRYTLGQTVGAGFDRIGALVPLLVENGLTTLQEG